MCKISLFTKKQASSYWWISFYCLICFSLPNCHCNCQKNSADSRFALPLSLSAIVYIALIRIECEYQTWAGWANEQWCSVCFVSKWDSMCTTNIINKEIDILHVVLPIIHEKKLLWTHFIYWNGLSSIIKSFSFQ